VNLHGLASGIGAVNPRISASLKQNVGFMTAADGSRTPSFSVMAVQIQVQAFSASELVHLQNLNINGVVRKVYIDGPLNSIIRTQGKGGDLLAFGGFDWLVVHVFESWADWSCVVIEQQLPASATPTLGTIYYGSNILTTLDALGIQSLQSNGTQTGYKTVFTFPATGYKYFSYPTSWGPVALFVDTLTGFTVPFQQAYPVTIAGTDYTVYRTSWVLNASIAIEVS
jgi:hypothetical protein